jgi:SAM-dependent methyltransferase
MNRPEDLRQIQGIKEAQGYFDHITRVGETLSADGWMFQPELAHDSVHAYLDGRHVGSSPAQERDDVAAVFPRVPHAGLSGFRFRVPCPPQFGTRGWVGRLDIVGFHGEEPVTRLGTSALTMGETGIMVLSQPPFSNEALATLGVDFERIESAVSPEDEMYVAGGLTPYYRVAMSALENIAVALLSAARSPSEVRRILDLPCGHGRVLRFLKAAFPEAAFYACDINRDGVEFCEKTFGAVGIYSHPDPANITMPEPVDLIWCGSLLTHLNALNFRRFLLAFERLLAPGGVLVFTIHGRAIERRMEQGDPYGIEPAGGLPSFLRRVEETGFAYEDYAHSPGYGISVSRSEWVMNTICRYTGMRIVLHREQGWDGHQDIVACVRS